MNESQQGTDFRLNGLRVAMILTNGYAPDVRVQKEAFALGESGAEVVIFAWDRTCAMPEVESVGSGITVRRIRIPAQSGVGVRQLPKFLNFWRAVVRDINHEEWDVLHAHDLDGLIPAMKCKQPRVGIVYDAHELFPLMVGERLGSCAERSAWIVERRAAAKADVIITDGIPRARVYHKLLHPRRIAVVENTVDLARFDRVGDKRAEIRSNVGIPADAWVVGVFTSLSGAKDLNPLWQALDGLPDIWVLVAGAGSKAREVEAIAARHPRVRFLGFIPDVAPWYGAVDAVYYALTPGSRNSRLGFPNNIATAVAAGVPLIASDVGECGRLMRRFRLGPVFRSGDTESFVRAMDRLRDPEVYQHFRDQLHAARPRFSWGRSRAALLEAYLQLLKAREPGQERGTGAGPHSVNQRA